MLLASVLAVEATHVNDGLLKIIDLKDWSFDPLGQQVLVLEVKVPPIDKEDSRVVVPVPDAPANDLIDLSHCVDPVPVLPADLLISSDLASHAQAHLLRV